MASEYWGYLMDGASYNFPLADKRIDDLRELLRTAFLNACAPAEEEPPAEMISAAECRAVEIANALIYEAPAELAAFLAAGQPPEVVEQIHGWLAMVTETSPEEIAARAALESVAGEEDANA
jgi:hypothetical protein